MRPRLDRVFSGLRIPVGGPFLLAMFFVGVSSRGQTVPIRGTLTGSVTADQGSVVGFRVTVHNVTYQLWYTVFTNKGHYMVPQALPGVYDVTALERGHTSATLRIELGSGETKTEDLDVKKRGERPAGAQGRSTKTVQYTMGGSPM